MWCTVPEILRNRGFYNLARLQCQIYTNSLQVLHLCDFQSFCANLEKYIIIEIHMIIEISRPIESLSIPMSLSQWCVEETEAGHDWLVFLEGEQYCNMS